MNMKRKKSVRSALYLSSNQIAHEYLSTKDCSYAPLQENFLEEAS